eukprot:7852887-Pyramimonas_sp.AAC.1
MYPHGRRAQATLSGKPIQRGRACPPSSRRGCEHTITINTSYAGECSPTAFLLPGVSPSHWPVHWAIQIQLNAGRNTSRPNKPEESAPPESGTTRHERQERMTLVRHCWQTTLPARTLVRRESNADIRAGITRDTILSRDYTTFETNLLSRLYMRPATCVNRSGSGGRAHSRIERLCSHGKKQSGRSSADREELAGENCLYCSLQQYSCSSTAVRARTI